ncbi:mechanosensitive ion channel family protein [Terrihabitans sp. B22-R8]|uniref:mechanosensitive ion channel family protein n=1 Tax=Terrihabitans sp. B22-R8 TaxID=3425128 RepID=UPI00403C1054
MDLVLPSWVLALPPWVWVLAGLGVAALVMLLASVVLAFVGLRFEKYAHTRFVAHVLKRLRFSLSLIVGTVAFFLLLPVTGVTLYMQAGLQQVCAVILVAAVGIGAYRLASFAFDLYAKRDGANFEDVHVRRRQTRYNLLRRLALTAIAVATIGLIFTVIPALQTVGVSLFASAGVAGIAIGLAARPAISNLLAGIQIAFSEPIRIGDQVVLEGEWGTVEDITSTYVVVNIWDQRRLILPLSYFLEKPFQNWTRENPQILGTSMLYVDYSVPVEEMRQELGEILKQSKYWDGRAWALQVTDLRENTMELRALMSARNAGSAFDLRCEVREKMVGWLKERHPEGLPRSRLDVSAGSRSEFAALAGMRPQ